MRKRFSYMRLRDKIRGTTVIMKIKRIHFADYKRFHDLTIDLGENPARIVALVGPNGCGKSSVFDGMLYHNNAYQMMGRGSNNTHNYKYHSLLQRSNVNYQNISIEFDQGSYESVRASRESTGEANTVFSFRSSFRYNGSLDVKESRAVDDIKYNNYGASTSSDIDTRIEDSYRRLKIKYDKYLNEKDCSPSAARKHIIQELNNAIHNCIPLEIDNLGSIEDNRGTLFFKKEDTSIPFEFNVLSSGEKEVVDILIDLYLRKDQYTDSIYIIDEPELHINTAIQRKLMVEINKMVPPNCQIWVATHSIGFLRALQEEFNDESQVIEFNSDNKWASEAYTLVPIIKSRTAWHRLFYTALDDLTSLVAPKTIVYCEGKDKPGSNYEERGLDAIVYNNIFGNAHPDVLFVSSGGNTELDQRSEIAIAILSKALPNTEILVLKDRDMASGRETTEEDRQLYLANNPINHRVLKRYEIENYLYDKEVLKSYCINNSLEFDETGYNRLVHDTCNQNLKDLTAKIKIICGITCSINPNVFKQNLSKYIEDTMDVYKELEQVIFERK